MENKNICLAILFIFFSSCISDFKEVEQVSLNTQESKEKKVFVIGYKVVDIQKLDRNYYFPIVSAWEEKAWQIVKDNDGKESYEILDSSSNHLVFSFNNEDTLITADNFSKGKWIMFMDKSDNSVGTIRGMINFNLVDKIVNDTTAVTIFRKKKPNDYKNNLTPLFKFNLIRE